MVEVIAVPDIGDFSDVEIIDVLIRAGDSVAVEQSLIALESDKATMEVPSPVAGKIVEVLVKAGDKVSQGSAIAKVEAATEAKAEAPTEAAAAPETPTEAAPAATAGGGEAEVRVPNIGDFKDVEIIEVLVKTGDSIAAEQSLIALESDKATMEVPSPLAGVVKDLAVKTGDRVSEGDLVAVVLVEAAGDSPPPPPPPKQQEAAPAAPPTAAPAPSPPPAAAPAPAATDEKAGGKPYAGPAIRRFARELGVDLTKVKGSGRKGRILREDVSGHVKTALSQPSGGGSALPVMPEVDFAQFGEVEVQPLSRINKLSASYLHRNWLLAPHVTQMADADITDMEEFRRSLIAEGAGKGYKITPLAFFVKATVAALKQFPRFNSSLAADGESLILKRYFHIGVAVDTPNGLVVPVLRNADSKGLTDIARELSELGRVAREGQLRREDMSGGCFTLSSLGGIGGSHFTPIINLPEVAILGISRSEMRPHWDGKAFIPRLKLPLALSYDHRVIDGAEGARFIRFYTELLGDIRRLTL